jgi:hypothetical protein
MQLRPLVPISNNLFWQLGGTVGGAMVPPPVWCRLWCRCGAVYDLFPFVASVCGAVVVPLWCRLWFFRLWHRFVGPEVNSLAVLIEP